MNIRVLSEALVRQLHFTFRTKPRVCREKNIGRPRRLSENWDRYEESGGRDQIFTDLRDDSEPIALKSGDIWAVIPLSAVDSQFSDSLLGGC